MSLTGWPLRLLLVGAAAAAFVAIVVLWPKLAQSRPATIASRAGMLLLVNLLVVATLAVQVNAHYLFFADWTDLHGALTGHLSKTSVSRGGSALGASRALVPGARAVSLKDPAPPGAGTAIGDLVSYPVPGPISGVTASVVVALPPGYLAPRNARRRYPVLEAFHGYPGTPAQWFHTMNLNDALARAVARHRVTMPLVVVPQLEIPAGADTECVNGSTGYPQLETWLARDVPDWVARHFRVRTDRASWATIGISAGGWCAAMIAMLHPSQFGAAIVLGGYFRPEFGQPNPPYPLHGRLASRYDLVGLARHHPPALALWLETSHTDPISYSSSAALLRVTRAPLAVAAVVLQHAGHHIGLWVELLPESLLWLGRNVAGFRPDVAGPGRREAPPAARP